MIKQPNCIEAQRRLSELKEEIIQLMNAEEQLAKQQAKVKWLEQGDSNTAYFHVQVKQRRSQNFIAVIQNVDGQWIDDPQSVHEEFLHYYQNFLGASSNELVPLDPQIFSEGLVLFNEQKEVLIQPIQRQEIKDAVFSIDKSKAPGPDDFSSGFFSAYLGYS